MSKLESLGHKAVLGKPYADKDRQEALIMESDLDWTIARPVILTKGPKSGRLTVLRDSSTWRNGLISRKDVATYLVDAVEQDPHVLQGVDGDAHPADLSFRHPGVGIVPHLGRKIEGYGETRLPCSKR